MACCVAANRTVHQLQRKEFVCRFLWLFCLVFLMERGQEKNVMEGFINYFTELNMYCRDEILQSAELGHIQPVHWKKIFIAEMGERQKIGRKPQRMWLLPLFGTPLQAEKMSSYFVTGLQIQWFPILSFPISALSLSCSSSIVCSGWFPSFAALSSLTMHYNYFILPHFVGSVISSKNMHNHGYFFLFLFSGKWPFLLLSDWWAMSKAQLAKVVFVARFLSKDFDVFSSSEFVQHLNRMFEIGKLGFTQTIIYFLGFLRFSLALLRCPEIRS